MSSLSGLSSQAFHSIDQYCALPSNTMMEGAIHAVLQGFCVLSRAEKLSAGSLAYCYHAITTHAIKHNRGLLYNSSHFTIQRKDQPLFSFVLFLVYVERILQQVHLLLQMRVLQPRCHTRAWIPPCVHDVLSVVMFGFVQQRLYTRLSETPRSSVKRLFLAPDDVSGIGIHIEVLL